jgi:hypothetical protein
VIVDSVRSRTSHEPGTKVAFGEFGSGLNE